MFASADKDLIVDVEIKDKFGNKAKVDGTPQWALTDESAGQIVPSEDGMSATLTPSGKAGDFQIQMRADADLGEGVKEIVGSLDVSIVAGEAVSVELKARPQE